MSERVAVLGAGLMGAQIGAEYALAGHPVTLLTRSNASANDAVARARRALRYLAEQRLASAEAVAAAEDRLAPATDVGLACAEADVIVESLPEDLAAKAPALRVAAGAAPRAIIASNTSSIPIAEIGAAAGAPERTIGTHYWNPPTLMPLVEVIPSEATSAAVRSRVIAMLEAMGKEPVVVKDVIGFVWNRLQFALLREAVRLATAGVADPATIDRIMRRGLARRWQLIGPFETMTLGGPRTFATIARLLFPEIEAHLDPDAILGVALPPSADLAGRAGRRDAALAELLRRERHGSG